MDYRNIKIHVPTPEISKLVQEKLFEKGCRWYSEEGVKHTHYNYLHIGACNLLSWIDSADSFRQQESKQLHYLQVLTGDDSGTLFWYNSGSHVYYQIGRMSYWVNEVGQLESAVYDLDHQLNYYPDRITLLNVNERGIMQDNSNEMPTLEAGKHVVRSQSGKLFLIVDSVADGLSGVELGGGEWYSNIQGGNYITEVHRISDTYNSLSKHIYDEYTLIWKRDDKAAEARKQYDELQRQIKRLQEQADKLGEKL